MSFDSSRISRVSKKAISPSSVTERLTIRAQTGHREYDDRVRLPATVDEHSAEATFNNGVLHVTFDRETESAAIDVE
mgnify:CR=1 FL=1